MTVFNDDRVYFHNKCYSCRDVQMFHLELVFLFVTTFKKSDTETICCQLKIADIYSVNNNFYATIVRMNP